MTVREYLTVHSGEDIESIGIYNAKVGSCEASDVIDPHVALVDLVQYLDYEVDHVRLGIFDETRKDINGNNYNAKFIRACIYVK